MLMRLHAHQHTVYIYRWREKVKVLIQNPIKQVSSTRSSWSSVKSERKICKERKSSVEDNIASEKERENGKSALDYPFISWS